MSIVARFRRPGGVSSWQAADIWTREADAISLPRLDEVGGHPRPSGFGVTYVEKEYEALADEQELSWPAEGEHAARRHQVQARSLDTAAAATKVLMTETEKEVKAAHIAYQHAAQVLISYVRRESFAKLRYWICWPLLVLGDMAGVWSAAVVLGDIPAIAFWQALASGLAAGCAGLVGSELKDLRLARARRRDPDSLSSDELRYRRLFTGTDGGIGIVKLIALLSLTVVALIAVGIFVLRSEIEGGISGLTFGLLAAATAIGSGLLGYSAADEVADLLATMEKRVRRAEKRYWALAGSKLPKTQAAAVEAASSIQAEYKLRGQAAGKRVESLGFRVLRRNSQVVGHGYPVGEQSGIIGRRARRGGVA